MEQIPSSENNAESYESLVEEFLKLEEDYDLLIAPAHEEFRALCKEQEEKMPRKWYPTPIIVAAMTGEIADRNRSLQNIFREFERREYELMQGLASVTSRDFSLVWKKLPILGTDGSLSVEHSQSYSTDIGETCELKMSWRDYPSIHEANNPDAYKDVYTLSLKIKESENNFETRFGVYETNSGDFEITHGYGEALDDSIKNTQEAEKLKQDILLLGRKLQDELGYPGKE